MLPFAAKCAFYMYHMNIFFSFARYASTDFTKNPGKYIKYDKDKLDKMISHLFEPAA